MNIPKYCSKCLHWMVSHDAIHGCLKCECTVTDQSDGES